MGRRLVSGLLAAVAVGFGFAGSARAAGTTYTVNGFSDGTGTCTATSSTTSACPTLRAAATTAGSGDTIQLAAGTYQLTLGQLQMGASTIEGTGPGGAGGTTIEQTDGAHRVIEVQAGPATLTGVEVTGGHLAPGWTTNTTWMGGGILAQAPLVLQDVLVTGNQVQAPAGPSGGDAGDNAEGGGIDYIVGSGAGSTISDSTITGNSALAGAGGTSGSGGGNAFGGGVAYEGNGPLVIQNSTVSSNAATGGAGGGGVSTGGSGGFAEGGGIWHSSDLTVTGSTVVGNTVAGGREGPGPSPGASRGGSASGGGIADIEALAEVVNSTVFQNLAQGGAPVTGGTAGGGFGGGIYDTGSDAGAALQSDTIDANQAGSDASNLYLFVGNPPNPYTFTLHDTIVAGGQPASTSSCDLHGSSNPPTSESNNLEDDAGDTCGFSAANHDLVGASPDLASALADNGGPTQTLAPAPGSPVLGGGGQCLDPTSTPPDQPLTVDQRGEPRSNPCDIGAFQAQRPRNTTLPAITGTARRGHALICSPGVWTGDGTLQYAFAWLRNGSPIPGATTNSYRVGPADPGKSISCRVTATYYGSVAATSKFLTVPSYPLVMLLRARVHRDEVTVDLGCRGPSGERCSGRMQLIVVEQLRGSKVIAVAASRRARKRDLTVAQRSYSLVARHTKTITIVLGPAGTRLLKRFGRLPVMLAVRQTTAAGTRTAAARKLKLRPPRRG
jgi:hypothetical protein